MCQFMYQLVGRYFGAKKGTVVVPFIAAFAVLLVCVSDLMMPVEAHAQGPNVSSRRLDMNMYAAETYETDRARGVDQSVSVSSSSTGNVVYVTAQNFEYTAVYWTPGCTNVTGPITQCVGSGRVSIPGRSSRTATITFNVGTGPESGSFTVNEMDNGTETISVTITAPVVRVAVTPQSANVTVPPGSSQSAAFTVQNPGTSTTTYSLSSTCGGSITCGAQPASPITIQAGSQATVSASYQAGGAGTTGSISLTAQSGSVSAYGTTNVTSDHVYGVTVSPKSQGVGVALSSPQSYTFSVHNASDLAQTYTTSVTCTGATVDPNSCAESSGGSLPLSAGATASVVVSYNTTASSGLATVSLAASNSTASDIATLTVHAPADGSMIVASNSTNNSLAVTAYNGEYTPLNWTPGCSNITGPITQCTGSPTNISIPGHESRSGTIYFDVGTGPASASFLPNALDSNVPTELVTISAPDFRVTVTPAQPTATFPPSTYQYLTFTVKNIGVNAAMYTTTATCNGAVSCPPNQQQIALDPDASTSIGVTFQTGGPGTTGTAQVTATSNAGSFTDTGVSTITSEHVYGVTVTPVGGGLASVGQNGTRTVAFEVHNASDLALSYALTLDCSTAPVTACGITSPATPVTIPGYGDTTVVVHLTGASPGSGHITLQASSGAASATGSFSINVVSLVDLSSANFGETVTRDRCLTFSLGKGAAYECGDLRLVHVLPVIRTMNEPRGPVLLYNSRYATPHPIVAADVTLPATAGTQTTIRAVLALAVDGGASRADSTWQTSSWDTAGTTRRIALTFDASNLPTGAYPYTLTVTSSFTSGAPASAVVTGMLIVVNRSGSGGWWLAGLEQLLFPSDTTTRLWVGGDGSARLYHWVRANVWKSTTVDRPDSLTFDGTKYTRWDEHRLRVQFDTQGRHVATINRKGYTTTFGYSGATLTSIAVPGASSSYAFASTGGWLDSTTVSIVGDTVRFTRDASGVTIRDPDGSTVRYGYAGPATVINSRTDRLGNVTTYQFDAASHTLSQASIAMQNPAPAIATSFRAAEGVALAGPVDTASVYTLVNGPRTDTTVTRIWIDHFGEPTRIVNALGGSTLLQRSDTRFPALVTQTTDPSGFITTATYDSHGNDSTVTRHDPLGDGVNPTTTYTWNQTFDFIGSVTQPTDEKVTMVYDSATGNRTSQYPGASSTLAVQFFYDPVTKNLAASQLPGTSARDSIAYDSLGNVRLTKTPLGHQTTYAHDAMGRIIWTTGPLDNAGSYHIYTQIQLDRMGRDTMVASWSDSGANSPGYIIRKAYDAEGNLLSVVSKNDPNQAIGTIKTAMTYDALSRETAEYTIGAAGDTVTTKRFTYDAAGNRTNGGGGGGAAVSVTFDALNRQIMRQSMDDSAAYSYDVAGRLLTANNRYAQVSRGYYPGGALRVDTLKIAVTDTTVGIPARFAQHIYRDSVTYDASERRATLVYPNNSSASYTYDPVFGNIATITAGPSGDRYSMQYDLAGRLSVQTRLDGDQNSLAEVMSYDADSRLNSDTVSGIGGSSSALRSQPIYYDARDKVLNAPTPNTPEAFTYSPLGAVITSNTLSGAAEEFTVDALGNAYTHELNGVTSSYTYHAGTTRLDMMLTPNGAYTDTTRYAYDIDGNRLGEATSHYLSNPTPGFTNNCAPVGNALCINTARSYTYDDENLLEHTLVMIDSTITHPPYYAYTTDEHFRYDALGRRVWARMNHSANCSKQKPWGGCFNTLLRSVWDGDQSIYEIQTNGDSTASLENDSPGSGSYGVVSYVHGAGLDSPLAIYKNGSLAVLPFQNYRGEVDLVSCPRMTSCSDVPVPGLTDGLNHLDGGTTSGPTGFYGTLQSEGKTGSGLVYARNRYVDPATGKFTQADPIGLAGGVNAWGFVGGDPVNYSDPFGLCPPQDNDASTCPGKTGALVMLGQMAPQINHEIATFLPKNVAAAVGGIALGKVIGAAVGRLTSQAVVHFTSVEGAAAIEQSGALRTGSFVAVPGEVAGRSAAEVENLLEIQPGRGAMSGRFRVPADALKTPFNGSTTSGGATQYQLTRPVSAKPGTFVPYLQ